MENKYLENESFEALIILLTKNKKIMSLSYVIRKGVNPASEDNATVYQGRAKQLSLMKTTDFCNFVADQCSATSSDVRGVLDGLIFAVNYFASNSFIVDLGELGSIKYSISSELMEDPEKYSNAAINKAKIVFNPGQQLKNAMKTVKYTPYGDRPILDDENQGE